MRYVSVVAIIINTRDVYVHISRNIATPSPPPVPLPQLINGKLVATLATVLMSIMEDTYHSLRRDVLLSYKLTGVILPSRCSPSVLINLLS